MSLGKLCISRNIKVWGFLFSLSAFSLSQVSTILQATQIFSLGFGLSFVTVLSSNETLVIFINTTLIGVRGTECLAWKPSTLHPSLLQITLFCGTISYFRKKIFWSGSQIYAKPKGNRNIHGKRKHLSVGL